MEKVDFSFSLRSVAYVLFADITTSLFYSINKEKGAWGDLDVVLTLFVQQGL